MKKIEAKTLEKAYEKAAEEFKCSIMDLEYEIVQHPSSGFLGLGAKKAIIVATCKPKPRPAQKSTSASKVSDTKKTDSSQADKVDAKKPSSNRVETRARQKASESSTSEETILNGFFDEPNASKNNNVSAKQTQPSTSAGSYDNQELGHMIENELEKLMSSTCFDIDVVEVDVIDGTAYIFVDGEDAALLIGKEGYRYNALSYLLYNWIHNEYGLFIKLEIAQFLASQQEMIRNYIQPVVDHVYKDGWGKTRPLDGILVQIALEQLREEFPNKYVAIKRTRNGDRYILINEFNKRP
jgi:spoIIIJ-associated protein